MRRKPVTLFLICIMAPFLLSACGGGSGDGDSLSTAGGSITTSSFGGVVVDPYISGAILQEIAEDGTTVLQRTSTPSDAQGRFQFPKPLTAGSTIEIKVGNRGTHVGLSNEVILRRLVPTGASGDLVVSPLTTLVANGGTENDIVDLMQSAGLTGFSANDIYQDPMAGLDTMTAVPSSADLRRLQAAMAVGNYLEAHANPAATALTLDFQAFSNLLEAVRATLNPTLIQNIHDQLAGLSLPPLGEIINTTVAQNRAIISMIRTQLDSNGQLDLTALQELMATVAGNMLNHFGNQGQPTTPNGTALYANNCASCHGSLATSSKTNTTAGRIQTAIDNNVGMMGMLSNLTAKEVQAIADALAGSPVVDPGTPPDGTTLYGSNCSSCHGSLANTGKPGRTAAEIQTAIDNNIGMMGMLSNLTGAEVQAIADVLPAAPVVNPGTPPDGTSLYGTVCASCHGTLANTNKPGRAATQIQAAIDNNLGNMGFLNNLTPAEVQAIADVLPAAPVVNPGTPPDGTALYTSECAGCHGPLATTNKPERTAQQIQTAIDNNVGMMGMLSNLAPAEVQAIADVLPTAPVVDPGTPPDGTALYSSSCASCHGTLPNTNKPERTAQQIQAAIDNNIGSMGILRNLTATEVQAIADVLPAAPVVDPGTPPDGTALYGSYCANCHGALDTTGKPGRTAQQIQVAIDNNVGNMGGLSTLTAAEVQAIADVLPADTGNGGPNYSDCTACHAQPPNGTTEPNVAGAHAAHQSIAPDCATCHLTAEHNGSVDLAFPAAYDYGGQPATDNMDGTCSSISCHGGNTTPDWWTGSINLSSDCTSCHSTPSSGQHRRHRSRSCTVCHNSSRMATHIGDPTTSAYEVNPASTVGGSGTSVGRYSNGSCSSISCHGGERW